MKRLSPLFTAIVLSSVTVITYADTISNSTVDKGTDKSTATHLEKAEKAHKATNPITPAAPKYTVAIKHNELLRGFVPAIAIAQAGESGTSSMDFEVSHPSFGPGYNYYVLGINDKFFSATSLANMGKLYEKEFDNLVIFGNEKTGAIALVDCPNMQYSLLPKTDKDYSANIAAPINVTRQQLGAILGSILGNGSSAGAQQVLTEVINNIDANTQISATDKVALVAYIKGAAAEFTTALPAELPQYLLSHGLFKAIACRDGVGGIMDLANSGDAQGNAMFQEAMQKQLPKLISEYLAFLATEYPESAISAGAHTLTATATNTGTTAINVLLRAREHYPELK